MLDFTLIVQATGFGAFLWLAFFIISRADRQRPQTLITFCGLFSTALLFFSFGYITITHGPANPILVRAFWWSNVFPMAFWFHICSQIARREARPIFTWPVWVCYSAATLITLTGMFTDLYLDYSHAQLPGNLPPEQAHYFYAPGAAYWTFPLFLLLTGVAGAWNIWRGWKVVRQEEPSLSPIDWKLRILLLGGLLFMAGALYITLRTQLSPGFELWSTPGEITLIVGLLLLGYAVAQYDMMVVGKNIQRDFIYSVTGAIVINVAYVVLVGLAGGITPHSLFVVVGLATTTHTLYDSGRALLDRLFFSRAEQQARAEAWAYATGLASQPVATPETPLNPEIVSLTDEKEFNNAVRRAITHLKNPTRMSDSPLLTLQQIGRRLQESGLADNRLNRTAVLRELLLASIERLRPRGLSDGLNTPGTGEAWRFYNVLYLPYVREISRKAALSESRRLEIERKRTGNPEPSDLEQLLNWLTDIDEDTFYKWQRRASDTIAALLREEEIRLS
jgi:hypothetical protein